jgi:hypothetical protein
VPRENLREDREEKSTMPKKGERGKTKKPEPKSK